MNSHTEKIGARRQRIRADHTRIRLILFLSLVIALLLAAVFAEWICPYDPNGQDLSIALQPPSPDHPFGTDRYGRDMLSRVIVGGQTSIFSALILVGIIAVGGTLLGLLCGYFGGALDAVIMRVSDICLAFPGAGVRHGCGGSAPGRHPKRGDCPGGGELAQICQTGQEPDSDGEKSHLYPGGKAFRNLFFGDPFPPHPAQHRRPGAGDGHAGYRHHDDGDRGPFFSGGWEPSPPQRSGAV